MAGLTAKRPGSAVIHVYDEETRRTKCGRDAKTWQIADGRKPTCEKCLFDGELSATAKQAGRFIYNYMAASNGAAPTIREIGDQMGIISTSHVYHLLKRLEAAGVIELERGSKKTRRIRLVGARYELPELPAVLR